jgi:hypothetical protein
MHMAPIRNDKDQVVLYLCQFKDITILKQPLDDDNTKGNHKYRYLIRQIIHRTQSNIAISTNCKK